MYCSRRSYLFEMLLVFIVILEISTLCESTSQVDQCLDRFVDFSLLQFRSRANRAGTQRMGTHMNDEIRIISSIVFNCNTSITSVILGVDVRPIGGMRRSFPSLQLWRPTGDGQNYQLVNGSERLVVYIPANVSRTGVYEYPLVPSIDVKPGDRIAISQPPQGESFVRCYFISPIDFLSHSINSGSTMGDLSGSLIENELVLIYPVADSPTCVNTSFTADYVRNQSLLISDSREVRDQRQFIYPDMDFRCNGTIKKWIFAGTTGSGDRQPELQIWRTVGDMYIKQSFSQVTVNETELGSNIHEFYPISPIEFMEGDVFGLFQPNDEDIRILAQRESGPNNYRVNPNANVPSTTLVISELRLEGGNDFPLVSLEISISVLSTSIVPETETSTSFLRTETSSLMSLTSATETSTLISLTSATETSMLMSMTTVTSTTRIISGSQSNDIISSSNNDNEVKLIGAVVAVCLLIVTIIVCTIIIVSAILRKKKTGGSSLPKDTNEQSLNNPVYQVNTDATLKSSRTIVPGRYEQQVETIYHQPFADSGNSILYDEIKSEEQNMSLDNTYNHLKWSIIVPTLDQRKRMGEQCTNIGETIDSIYSVADVETNADSHCKFLDSNQGSFFEETNVYWTPAMDYEGLYEQLASKNFREILTSQISVSSPLGSGNFGKVMKGAWESPDGLLPVAVKTLKEQATDEEKVKFLQEAAIMGQFHHPNIVKIFGVVTLQEPLMIVIELMHNGDLQQYLRILKPSPGEMVAPFVPEMLLSFCRQVSSAMEYLSKKCFIHRDIAARNVLVTADKNCKISDFGMSRDLEDETYYVSKGGELPIKWTAPEALLYKKFSTASDVWSFGVLMYEIWSLGEKPFQKITNQHTFRMICDGYRLPPPSGCPRAMYETMIQCWHPMTSDRPTFSKLVFVLLQPDGQLLKISVEENEGLHQQAFVLGASLEAGQNLYLDLQNMYKSHKIN